MAKKRKKIVRPQYTTKADRAKQAPKKPIPRELKFGLIFCAAALIIAIILVIVLYDDGSLPVHDGIADTGGEPWIVANVSDSSNSPKYYKTGEITAPLEGYTLDAENIDTSGLNTKLYAYTADDPDNQIIEYYVTGINRAPDVNAEAASTNYALLGSNYIISPVETIDIDGKAVSYFTVESVIPEVTDTDESETTEENPQLTQQMISYIPAIRNTTILAVITADISNERTPLSGETLSEFLAEIMATITFEEK